MGVWVCTLGCKCTVYGIVCRCMYAYGCVCVLLCMWVRVGVIKVCMYVWRVCGGRVCGCMWGYKVVCGGCVVCVWVAM